MQGTSKYILVCDDSAENCFLFQTLLEIEGYEVDTAHSGTAALALIESKAPDLLLLDVMMPGIDGYEVARRIQQNPVLQTFPILLITAYEEALVSRECEARVDGVIRKPVNIDALLTRVSAALQN